MSSKPTFYCPNTTRIPGDHSSCVKALCVVELEVDEMKIDDESKALRRRRNLKQKRPDWLSSQPPRGKEVDEPEILKHRPLKPPGFKLEEK